MPNPWLMSGVWPEGAQESMSRGDDPPRFRDGGIVDWPLLVLEILAFLLAWAGLWAWLGRRARASLR